MGMPCKMCGWWHALFWMSGNTNQPCMHCPHYWDWIDAAASQLLSIEAILDEKESRRAARVKP